MNRPLNEITLDMLPISVRAYNCLKSAGVDSLDSLIKLTPDQLKAVPKLADKGIQEVIDIRSKVKAGDFSFIIEKIPFVMPENNTEMSDKAFRFAINFDVYCHVNRKIVPVKFNTKTQSWADAIDTICRYVPEDVEKHIAQTGDSIEQVREKIEKKLIDAAERDDVNPELFPL